MNGAATKGYTLVICEKPDAARKVSEALSGNNAKGTASGGVTTFAFKAGTEDCVVCSAQGHLYAVADPFEERSVYPVFDVEWYPTFLVERDHVSVSKRLAALAKLAQGARRFVNACDLDAEGETIGYNILRYACGGKELQASRMKFSTLTKADLVEAFRTASPRPDAGLARAGRTRHLVDFVWGVNLSRFLSQAGRTTGQGFRTMSVGRVQGPTLKFLAERELEIQTFVPTPGWKATGVFDRNGSTVKAQYSIDRLRRLEDASRIRSDCVGEEAAVSRVIRNRTIVPPRPPFNLGALQREAFYVFGLTPDRTLGIAEKLYLRALISYPRTGSERLPPSIDYRRILEGLAMSRTYKQDADKILRGELRPAEGPSFDPAHPAIHPTGEHVDAALNPVEAKIHDLVVRRFLSTFAPSAVRETVAIAIEVGDHEFRVEGGRTVFQGWMAFYSKYLRAKEVNTPRLAVGDSMSVLDVVVEESFDRRPARYNQGTLLEKMEREGIGTKSTRAEVISTIMARGYATGASLAATDLGLSLAGLMDRYSPMIMTMELTRAIEKRLAAVEEGSEGEKDLIRNTIRTITDQLATLHQNGESVGMELGRTSAQSSDGSQVLGQCPVCRTGKLRIVRSRKTRKRFVGCSRYAEGCRASAPLPQRGRIGTAVTQCKSCAWPIVAIVGRGRRAWKLCVNPDCPSKEGTRS